MVISLHLACFTRYSYTKYHVDFFVQCVWYISKFVCFITIFRHLFCELDGDTDGPEGPNGPIGRCIKRINSTLRNFVNFETISSNLPAGITKDLFYGREDLTILLDLVRGVEEGRDSIDVKYITKGGEISEGICKTSVNWHKL